MADVGRPEPQSAADYGERSTDAVRSALVEIGQILGSFKGKFAVIGGAVPWLLLNNPEMPHVGTLDVDLDLDAEALGDGEYATLIEALMNNGYRQRDGLKRFQLIRRIPAQDAGPDVDVVVDFLMPRDAVFERNKPPILDEFAVQKADGAELALHFPQTVSVSGRMPGGGSNRVELSVCSIPAFLAMKGHALRGRHKQKDAYDVYYCIRNYEGGIAPLADACRPLLEHPSAVSGYRIIAEKFAELDGYGPTSVRNFVVDTPTLGERTPDEWQQDAFGQVAAWLRALGLDG